MSKKNAQETVPLASLTKEELRQCMALTEQMLHLFNGHNSEVIEVACINAIGSVYISHCGNQNTKEIVENMTYFALMLAQAIEQIVTDPSAIVSRQQLNDMGLISKPS